MMKSNDRCESSKRPQRRVPVRCPKCFSYNASVIGMSPPNARCRCMDCGTIYNYRMSEITNGADDESAGEEQDFASRSRKAKTDSRAQILPAAAPELGFNAPLLDEAIGAGPAGFRKAQHVAPKYR